MEKLLLEARSTSLEDFIKAQKGFEVLELLEDINRKIKWLDKQSNIFENELTALVYRRMGLEDAIELMEIKSKKELESIWCIANK